MAIHIQMSSSAPELSSCLQKQLLLRVYRISELPLIVSYFYLFLIMMLKAFDWSREQLRKEHVWGRLRPEATNSWYNCSNTDSTQSWMNQPSSCRWNYRGGLSSDIFCARWVGQMRLLSWQTCAPPDDCFTFSTFPGHRVAFYHSCNYESRHRWYGWSSFSYRVLPACGNRARLHISFESCMIFQSDVELTRYIGLLIDVSLNRLLHSEGGKL